MGVLLARMLVLELEDVGMCGLAAPQLHGKFRSMGVKF